MSFDQIYFKYELRFNSTLRNSSGYFLFIENVKINIWKLIKFYLESIASDNSNST
jgi:hypothetical protein